jgi:WXG100 family type VII secretion target
MSTLHMDVESVRNVSNQMKLAVDSLQQTLINLNESMSGLVGNAWHGNSSVEFQQVYEGWRSQVISEIDRLEQLRISLENEIAQWESMASRLG